MTSSPSFIDKLKAPFKEAKMFTMLILGYASGFPLMLTPHHYSYGIKITA